MRSLLAAALLALPAPPTLDAIRAAEDARARTAEQLDVLRAGAHAPSPELRRVAVRALGRLQRAALIPEIVAALDDPAPGVRAAAADALLLATSHGGASEARAAALARLAAERNAAVVGALAESAGWIAHRDTVELRATAESLAAATGRAPLGAVRGLFGLARQPIARRALPAPVVSRLAALATSRRASTVRDDVETRELAAAALVASQTATADMLDAVLADPDRRVRAVAVRGVVGLADSVAAERIGRRALGDAAASVRTLAVASFARRFAARRGCAPYVAAAADRDLGVRLAALDAAGACADAAALLDAVAATLGADTLGTVAWHAPAHALLSLAVVAPARAAAHVPTFAASGDFFVRDYAARAAARLRDTTTLRRLAADAHPNVRTTALAGLAATLGHEADDAYLAALADDDSQVLQTAAKALEGSGDPRAAPALLAALDRVSARRVETSRDARLALLERVRTLGDSSSAARLVPYVADFDTTVAAQAADAVGAWTGRRPTPAPAPLALVPVPTSRELDALARARVELHMRDGAVVVIRVFPHDAPTNAARFVRLARAGRFDGLTFHRVVAPRFVQGLSPAANEYAGWGPFTRDELARSNRRGTVGLSTRGRDTGDGQIYVNVGDVFELDHGYTVFGEVVSGIDAVERFQEGARVARAIVR